MAGMNTTIAPAIKMKPVRIRSARFWIELFRAGQQRDWQIPWGTAVRLTEEEWERIAASVADFQRGESSEALGYMAKSRAFSQRMGDVSFHEASEFFIGEEHLHSRMLGRFMEAEGIPRRGAFLTDGIFRWLRGLSDIGWSSRIILVAELVAQEYYPSLRMATGHPVLVRMCDKIISDEVAHVRFQVERIVRVEVGLTRGARTMRDRAQAVVLALTLLVVYLEHRSVLRCRLGMREFIGRVWIRNRRAVATMRALQAAWVADALHLQTSRNSSFRTNPR